MKNIQVIDGALNAVYDIFQATDEEFSLIFRMEKILPSLMKESHAESAATSMRFSQESGSGEYPKHGQWACMACCSTSSTTRSSITRHVATRKP